nr:hypothetical protein [Anaerolineae bacterium]
MTWRIALNEIVTDNLSGASTIVSHLLSLFARHAGQLTCADLQTIAEAVLDTHSAMASVVHLMNRVCLMTEDQPTTNMLPGEHLVDLSCTYADELKTARKKAVAHTVPFLAGCERVLTISYSSLAYSVLLECARSKPEFEVVCLESRPMNEGKMLASLLADKGVHVTYAVDAAAGALMNDCCAWVVGFDSVLPDGIVNKLGTSLIAAYSSAIGKPGYGVGESTKIWPRGLRFPGIGDQPDEEIWESAPENIALYNRYFDLTGFGGALRVVTDIGSFTDYDSLALKMTISLSATICSRLGCQELI